jgi:hypothetical protein
MSRAESSVRAESADEAIVTHVTARAAELIGNAARRKSQRRVAAVRAALVETEPQQRQSGALRRFAYDPLFLAIGAPLIVAAIVALAVWLF